MRSSPGIILLLCACAQIADAKPNIVLILSNDHSYPFLGCYGREELKTPNFDRFAAEGIKFRRMFTSAPASVSSRAAILTGRSAVACRITRASSTLPRDEITFPEILKKEAGYFVGVCGGAYDLDGAKSAPSATAAVLDERRMRSFPDRFDYVDASGQANLPVKLNGFFDKRPKNQPYLLWVNFEDPQYPWNAGKNPPDPAKLKVPGFLPDLAGVRKDLALHQGEIEHCDGDFAGVLELIKNRAGLEDTLFIFMGANGMALPSGKGSLHDPGLNVPMLVKWQGIVKAGGDSNALLSGEDIAPTCLEAAGVKAPEAITGISFLPLLLGKSFNERQYIFAAASPHGTATPAENGGSVDYSRCARSARYKLIYSAPPSIRYTPADSSGAPSWLEIIRAHEKHELAAPFEALYFTGPRPIYEFYDLERDPDELHNLYGGKNPGAAAAELKVALQKKMIVDFDFLALPIAATGGGHGKGKGGGQKSAPAETNSADEPAGTPE